MPSDLSTFPPLVQRTCDALNAHPWKPADLLIAGGAIDSSLSDCVDWHDLRVQYRPGERRADLVLDRFLLELNDGSLLVADLASIELDTHPSEANGWTTTDRRPLGLLIVGTVADEDWISRLAASRAKRDDLTRETMDRRAL